MSRGRIFIGISGWRYVPWRGTFYPQKLAQRRELEFASRRFKTIEINGSFYSLQRPQSFEQWFAETPVDFTFSVKGSRYITHMLRLRNIEGPLANFFAQGLLRLGTKLGPVLWQFPPNFVFDAGKFEDFLAMLPTTHKQAADLARKHDSRMQDRSWFQVKNDAPLRHAVEIRNESFANEQFIRILRRYGVASVVADTVEWPLLMDVSANFVYCRLHGSEELYASGYDAPAIEIWARRVATWAEGGEVEDGRKASARNASKRAHRDVYVYFDNDIKVRAPFDAEQLRARVDEIFCENAARSKVDA